MIQRAGLTSLARCIPHHSPHREVTLMLKMIAPSGRIFVVSDEEAIILTRLGWKRAES